MEVETLRSLHAGAYLQPQQAERREEPLSLTWRYTAARIAVLQFDAEHAAHIAALIANKVACPINKTVSLPRVRGI